MAFTYTAGSVQPLDRVRSLIPDKPDSTQTPQAFFEDAEILDRIEQEGGDLFEAAAQACEIIAMDKAKQALSVSLPTGFSISKTSIPSFFLQRAKMLREKARSIPVEEIDSVEYDVSQFGADLSDYVGDKE